MGIVKPTHSAEVKGSGHRSEGRGENKNLNFFYTHYQNSFFFSSLFIDLAQQILEIIKILILGSSEE